MVGFPHRCRRVGEPSPTDGTYPADNGRGGDGRVGVIIWLFADSGAGKTGADTRRPAAALAEAPAGCEYCPPGSDFINITEPRPPVPVAPGPFQKFLRSKSTPQGSSRVAINLN